jgi:hypothetical protein
VKEVRQDGNTWAVSFTRKKRAGKVCDFTADKYDNVILALPKGSLDSLKVLRHHEPAKTQDRDDKDWRPTWMHWVKGHRMFKLFLLYDEPWWMGDSFPDGCDGRVFTDLPLRQVYYFSPSWMCKHGTHDQSNEKHELAREGLSLIMASYSDEHYVSFWEPLLNPKPELDLVVNRGPFHLFRSDRIPKKEWHDILEKYKEVLVTRRMVDKVQGLLNEIHGREVPQPILGVVQDWEAGWHTWVVGSKPWKEEIRGERVEPFFEKGLFLCGEAYSTEQGWIEGALKSAEQVLKELLGTDKPVLQKKSGLTRPDWLKGVPAEDFDSYVGCWDWESVKAARRKKQEDRGEKERESGEHQLSRTGARDT